MSKTITASGPLTRWRTIDLLTCAFLGVAFGVAYWAWGLVYSVPSEAVSAAFPPLGALFNWPWLVAGIVGMLIIRRPGAAVFTELLAAVVSALIGTQWGLTTLVSGLVQGLGVELGFAVFAYAVRWPEKYRLPSPVRTGAGSRVCGSALRAAALSARVALPCRDGWVVLFSCRG